MSLSYGIGAYREEGLDVLGRVGDGSEKYQVSVEYLFDPGLTRDGLLLTEQARRKESELITANTLASFHAIDIPEWFVSNDYFRPASALQKKKKPE